MTSRARRTIVRTTAQAGGVVLAAGFLAGFGLAPSGAEAKAAAKVTICHATSSTDNPYIKVTVPASTLDGKGKNDHTSHGGGLFDFSNPAGNSAWGDIIPDVEGVAFSMNATVDGLGIFANGCNGPDEGSCPDGSDPVGGTCPTEETCPSGLPAVAGECGDDEVVDTSDGGTTDGGSDGIITDDGGATDGTDGQVISTDDGGTDDGGATDGVIGTDDGGTTDGGSDGIITDDGGATDGTDGQVISTDDGGTDDGGTDDGGATDGVIGTDDGGTDDGGATDSSSTGETDGDTDRGADGVVSTDDGGTDDGGTAGGTDGTETKQEVVVIVDGGTSSGDPEEVVPVVADSASQGPTHGLGTEVQGKVVWGSTARSTWSSLPLTGAESLLLAAAGVVLVALGVAMAVWARLSRA